MFAISGTSSAASPKAKAVVTLQYWNTYNQADSEGKTMANVIIPRFEKLNPGIKVKSTYVLYADLLNKFITTSAAGDPPDVMRSDIAWVAQLAQEGIIKREEHQGVRGNQKGITSGTARYNRSRWQVLRFPRHQHPSPVLEQGRLCGRGNLRSADDHQPNAR